MNKQAKDIVDRLLDRGAVFYSDYTTGLFSDFHYIYNTSCKNNEDKEKFYEEVLEYLKENSRMLIDDFDVKIFTKDDYPNLFCFIKDENCVMGLKKEYPNLFEKEILEKHYIGKTFDELLKTEKELLNKFNIKLYKDDIILNYDIGVSIKGQEVNGEIIPLAEDVFSYEFLDR